MSLEEKTARIILEDGTEFEGSSFGYEGSVAGDIVFYNGADAPAPLFTDPSLRGTILVMAQPQVGNTGIPEDEVDNLGLETDFESGQAQISGLVVMDYCDTPSHWKNKKPLAKWLRKQQVPALSGVDTRALIQRIRLRGSMRAKILVEETKDVSFSSAGVYPSAYAAARRVVRYGTGTRKIALIDCGAKNSQVRALVSEGTTVVRVPCSSDLPDERFDGFVVSGGPGDPTAYEKTIALGKGLIAERKPLFAIGQGAVILAIAGGAASYRMTQGHRGQGVPCVNLETGRCHVTAQNHGYGIRDDSLPPDWYPTFLNNTDNSIEGFATAKGLISGVLFQPEGNPGPRETAFLYEAFLEIVRNGGVRA